MAITDVVVPQLSESVSEATLLTWKKQPGAAVEADEILIEVETDKVVLEVPAPASGVLAEIVKGDGSTVTSGEVLARIDTAGKAAVAAAAPAARLGRVRERDAAGERQDHGGGVAVPRHRGSPCLGAGATSARPTPSTVTRFDGAIRELAHASGYMRLASAASSAVFSISSPTSSTDAPASIRLRMSCRRVSCWTICGTWSRFSMKRQT